MNPEQKPEYNKAPDTNQLIAEESGAGRFPVPPVIPGGLPAGGSVYPVPPYQSKTALINSSGRSYFWSHDAALMHSKENAIRMLNDPLIRDSLMVRWAPIVQLAWHLEAEDPTDPRQVDGVDKLTKVILRTPKLQDFFLSLLWGEWFGRAGVALIYDWSVVGDEKWMIVERHVPINGDSLISRWSGDWGQRVTGTYQGAQDVGDGLGWAHFYTPVEREAIVIHTAPSEDADFYQPELAGQISGSSLRGHVYWYWYLKSNFESLLADFGERFVNGVWLGWYDSGDEAAKTNMASTLAGYSKDRSILLPRDNEGKTAYGLDIKEVGSQSPTFLMDLVTKFETIIQNYLTGRSLNEMDQPVGGDGAGLVQDRISRAVKYSATRLAESLSTEWLPVLSRYNCPGIPPPKFKFEIDAVNASELIGFAQALSQFGYQVPVDDFVELCGLPQAGKGDTVYSQVQPMSPLATETPQGVPQVQGDPTQPPQSAPPQSPAQPSIQPSQPAPQSAQSQPNLLA